jgi:hypothetical protein
MASTYRSDSRSSAARRSTKPAGRIRFCTCAGKPRRAKPQRRIGSWSTTRGDDGQRAGSLTQRRRQLWASTRLALGHDLGMRCVIVDGQCRSSAAEGSVSLLLSAGPSASYCGFFVGPTRWCPMPVPIGVSTSTTRSTLPKSRNLSAVVVIISSNVANASDDTCGSASIRNSCRLIKALLTMSWTVRIVALRIRRCSAWSRA